MAQDSEMPPEMSLPEQVQLLNANAEVLAREGRHDDAERVVRQVLQAAPRHIPALQYLASRALTRNDLEGAKRYLERAIRAAPRMVMLHQNLGIVLRAQGFLTGALKAFGVALRIDPSVGMIWVQLGDVLQSLGRHEEAIAAYCRSEAILGFLPRAASENHGRVRQALGRAAKTLQQARVKSVSDALAPLREQCPTEDMGRAERAIATLLRVQAAEFEDPLQRPQLAYFPGIEASPFFDPERFEPLRGLEAATDKIRNELKALLNGADQLAPYVDIPGNTDPEWRDLNGSERWSSYHLYRNSERLPAHCEQCPETHAAVAGLPLPRLGGQSPEVFFSILRPGTHIPPHYGLANYKLTVHLPLITPPKCAIRVGDRTRSWRSGECLVFDDSFEHEAWNNSDSLRAVLILEAWHPDIREQEREFLGVALSALDRFNNKYKRMASRVAAAAADA